MRDGEIDTWVRLGKHSLGVQDKSGQVSGDTNSHHAK
jgi:hypothetical protein